MTWINILELLLVFLVTIASLTSIVILVVVLPRQRDIKSREDRINQQYDDILEAITKKNVKDDKDEIE